MPPAFSTFQERGYRYTPESSDEEHESDVLSHVGVAAYDILQKKHNGYHRECWNVTDGKVVRVNFTPADAFARSNNQVDPLPGHSDWYPKHIEDIISKAEDWVDITTLSPNAGPLLDPDSKFIQAIKNGIKNICENVSDPNKKVVIRIMYGNIPGIPVDITSMMNKFTDHLPEYAKNRIKLWVGSWRKGKSWNHSKIVAVDGKYLLTGGHNMWDCDYLRSNPVNDLSISLEGNVARDGHRYANAQWEYISKKQNTRWGNFVDKRLPDGMDIPRKARVTVSNFPESSTTDFPPAYSKKRYQRAKTQNADIPSNELVPVITAGRYGSILKTARPADDAFVAMFDSAQKSIDFALQDLGPMLVPGTKIGTGGSWPTRYMNAWARAIFERGVDIQIVLDSGKYGFGWTCVDVAAEIIKCIKSQFPQANDGKIRELVEDNLRVCFIRCERGGRFYSDGTPLGLHSKHFIVDDTCCYIGSQNLYDCDLAEWGVIIDSPEAVADIKQQYFDPLWKVSYTKDDCNVNEVMDGLDINRMTSYKTNMDDDEQEEAKKMMKAKSHANLAWLYDSDESDESDTEDEDDDDDGIQQKTRGIKLEDEGPPPYWIMKYGKKIRNPEHVEYCARKYG